MDAVTNEKLPYETPTVRVVDEADMLAQFQLTVAVTSWWA
jgi:hypothetical protein